MNPANIVFLMCLILIIWYFTGIQVNRKKGIDFLKGIREKLSMIGEDATIQWIGSSGFQIRVHKPLHPLKNFALLLLLQTREFPFIWIFQQMMARKDVLVIKADLINEPSSEVELWRKNTAFEKQIIRELQRLGHLEYKDLGKWSIAHKESHHDPEWTFVNEINGSGIDIQRVSVKRKSPHIVLIVFLKKGVDFTRVFEVLKLIIMEFHQWH